MSQPTVQTYPMEPLSVRPSAIRGLGTAYVLPETFGKMEAELMAAVLITMCRELGDAWQGFVVSAIGARVSDLYERAKAGDDDCALFFMWPGATFRVGLNTLRDNGAIRVESRGWGDNAFDVVYPTERMIDVLRSRNLV